MVKGGLKQTEELGLAHLAVLHKFLNVPVVAVVAVDLVNQSSQPAMGNHRGFCRLGATVLQQGADQSGAEFIALGIRH
ncbi:hypothetical protein D3C79_893980 [compost metagenome]